MKPLLTVAHLKTYFETDDGAFVRANDDVSLGVCEGELVAVVGESGCGKSTVALSILRLIKRPGRIIEGTVFFRDIELLKLSEEEMRKIRGKEISIVFQNPVTYLNPVMKIGDQIAENAMFHMELDKKGAKVKALEVLKQVKIPTPERIFQSYPHELSGGMKQRVLIAIAIVCHPLLVMLDEPTTALDVTIQGQILQLIKDLRNRLGMSMILITHDLGIVADIADRVYIMYAGQIVEHSDVFSIFREPLHPYSKALLNSVLSINEYKENLVSIPGVVPDLRNPPTGCRFHPRCSRRKDICIKEIPLLKEEKEGHFISCWDV
jgi:oligopeptide/dipeptide ABC transporter ATP-binding protein